MVQPLRRYEAIESLEGRSTDASDRRMSTPTPSILPAASGGHLSTAAYTSRRLAPISAHDRRKRCSPLNRNGRSPWPESARLPARCGSDGAARPALLSDQGGSTAHLKGSSALVERAAAVAHDPAGPRDVLHLLGQGQQRQLPLDTLRPGGHLGFLRREILCFATSIYPGGPGGRSLRFPTFPRNSRSGGSGYCRRTTNPPHSWLFLTSSIAVLKCPADTQSFSWFFPCCP
jgi:hypothetical protein